MNATKLDTNNAVNNNNEVINIIGSNVIPIPQYNNIIYKIL
jgi:hypothetical protein